MRKKSFSLLLIITAVLTIGIFYFCNFQVEKISKGKLYSDVNAVPYKKVGLLLGTGKYLESGQINPYYRYRIEAAARLFFAGKIKYIIISGDNSSVGYDEPTMMRADLIASGIDSAMIFLDYAGFRTFDSIIRAKEVFGQNSITVISQPFHNERAIYIASREKVSAIGFNATDVARSHGFKVQVREKFARVKVYIDFLFNTEPKFLGPKVVIPG